MNGNKRVLGSNLAKIDSHTITPEEYKEIPELSADFFAQAEEHFGGQLVRRGRPVGNGEKVSTTILPGFGAEDFAALGKK